MQAHVARPGLTVSLLALPETTVSALFGLYEVFSSVGVTWAELTGEPCEVEPLSVAIVGPERGSFTCVGNVAITPHRAFHEVNATDLVVVPDLALPIDRDPRGRWPEAAEWLRRQHDAGASVCSVCSGSVLLADAGLLEDREATTHWAYHQLFSLHYPNTRWRTERVLVTATEDGRVVTGGGASSWEDLVLYLVARYCGQAEAVRIAKLFLFGDRRDGQLPYAAMTRPREHGDRAIAEAQAWIAEHYAEEHPVQRMAERAGLNLRTFKRRFAAATGMAPLDYVQALRIEEARQMLERSDASPEAVAEEVGYSDPTFFRRLFRRRTGMTPSRYRRRFAAVGRPLVSP